VHIHPAGVVARNKCSAEHDDQPGTTEPDKKSSSSAKRRRTPESGEALCDEIYAVFGRYMVMTHPQKVAATLWTLFSHIHAVVDVSPILRITSPEKRCGKTTLLLILQGLVHRPQQASSASPAALFRIIDQVSPTLLLDESEHWFGKNSEMTAIFNAGHYRRSSDVLRCQGKKFKAHSFSAYCPKVLSGIGHIADTTADRSIVIELRRKTSSDISTPLRGDIDQFKALHVRIAKWGRAHAKEVKQADPTVPTELNDRAADNWRPLFSIAELIGEKWAANARAAALALTPARDDDGPGVRLLKSIYDELGRLTGDRIASSELCRHLNDAASLYKSYSGRDLNQHSLARLLRPFDIYPRNIRWSGHDERGRPGVFQTKGYLLGQFNEAFRRYIPNVVIDETSNDQNNDMRAALDDEILASPNDDTEPTR
jgi:hypothetical protein